MSQPLSYEIPNVSDKLIFDRLGKAAKTFSTPITNLYVTIPEQQIQPAINGKSWPPDELSSLLELNQKFISSIGCAIGVVTFTITRAPTAAHANLKINIQAGHFLNNAATIKTAVDFFEPIDATARVSSLASPEAAQYLRALEDKLQKLTDKSADVISGVTKQVADYAIDGERRVKERIGELDADHQKKNLDLSKREEALAARLKTIDDRDSKHARRQIRSDLKSLLENRSKQFALSSGTNNLRRPIGQIILVSLLVSLSFMSVTGYEIYIHSNTGNLGSTYMILLSCRWILSALAFGATVIYYIKWQNHWFRQHADEEFKLKRLELDIDRASWVGEMSLEWLKDHPNGMPEILLDRLTQNIFSEQQLTPEPQHPADQLASALLGSAAKVTLSAGEGNKIELDRKAVRDLAKQNK